MTNSRLLQGNDMDILRSMFDFNNNNNGIKLSDAEITKWCESIMDAVKKSVTQVAVNFDVLGEPMAMVVSHEKSAVNGWMHGLSVIRRPTNHYNKSAPILAPALDLMMNFMESKGYYKYWAINPKAKLDIRYKIMCKYSTTLHRYDSYDEMIIPAGQLSGVLLWDSTRRIHNMDTNVKLYVLRQEYRLPLIKL